MKLKASIAICFWLLACSLVKGQIEEYEYKRPLEQPADPWHKVILPDELFGKATPDLNDLRIFGVTQDNDTLEAPYILQLAKGEVTSKEVSFKMLNTSFNQNGYYFTFEIPTKQPINQIQLDIQQQNFDWQLTLEGSQDLQTWFTVVTDYRILSIKNDLTDYRFTKVTFPDAQFLYFRLRIDSKEKPELKATITQHGIVPPTLRDYKVQKMLVKEIKERNQTIIDLELPLPVPVSHLKLNVDEAFDYYRPITIHYLSDSIKTEQGWVNNYRTITSSTLSSIETDVFPINSTVAKKIRVTINNYDSTPLSISNVEVKGYTHSLVARFTEPAEYFLVYGNGSARKPNYDISLFADKIPEGIATLNLGSEETIKQKAPSGRSPLFVNQWWLWAIMALIIVLLGWFTFNMIRKP